MKGGRRGTSRKIWKKQEANEGGRSGEIGKCRGELGSVGGRERGMLVGRRPRGEARQVAGRLGHKQWVGLLMIWEDDVEVEEGGVERRGRGGEI